MAQFKSILVPVDIAEPDTARPAIERAADLAHASYGTIRLIYVRSILPVTYMEFVPPNFDAEQQREAEQKLARSRPGFHCRPSGSPPWLRWARSTMTCCRKLRSPRPTSSSSARTARAWQLISSARMP